MNFSLRPTRHSIGKMLGCAITGAGWKPPSGITSPSGRITPLSCQSRRFSFVEELLHGHSELFGERGDVPAADVGAGRAGRRLDRLPHDDHDPVQLRNLPAS